MSEQAPLQPRVKSILDKEISTSRNLTNNQQPTKQPIWFTANLAKLSQNEREKYIRMLRTKLQESLKARTSLDTQAAWIMSSVEAPVQAPRKQDEPDQAELKHAEHHISEEAKREMMIERLVHDAKHEGLEALLTKVELTIWEASA